MLPNNRGSSRSQKNMTNQNHALLYSKETPSARAQARALFFLLHKIIWKEA
jgi:hypothetical protein